MLPELEGDPGSSRRFVTPDTFNIEYQWVGGGGKQNSYLNKIATCVLKNMSVKYGGGRYSAHVDDGEGSTPPVESEMTLQFQELEIITKTKNSAVMARYHIRLDTQPALARHGLKITEIATSAASTRSATGTTVNVAIVLTPVFRLLAVVLFGATVSAALAASPKSATGMAAIAAVVLKLVLRVLAIQMIGATAAATPPVSTRSAIGMAAT